nr:putative structural protein [Hepevirus sp.]
MAKAVNNDMDFDMFSNLSKSVDSEIQSTASTETNPQAAFIRKSIHPPSAIPNYNGIPTNDARSQVLVQWRNPVLMKQPIIFDTALGKTRYVTANDLTQFDMAILHTNGARVLSVPFIFNKTTGGMNYDFNNVDLQDAYDFTKWQDDANLYRPVFKSTTTYLNATMFNNTGMVVGNQFNPNILFAGSILTFAHEHTQEFFHFCRTVLRKRCVKLQPRHEEHAHYTDLFRCFPKYIRDEMSSILDLSNNEVLNLDPNTKIQVFNAGDLGYQSVALSISPVPTSSQIMNNSMRSGAWKAQDGTFTVQRLNTISPSWLSASNTNNAESGLYECYFYIKDSTGVTQFSPFYDNAPENVDNTQLLADYILHDTLWSKDMTWGWTFYQGLSLNSQSSTATQLLIKKYYTGYEVQPTPRSAWSGMVNLGPKPDLMAMQALMDAFYELKDILPAKYNFWGTLGTLAAQGLKTFGSSILDSLISGGSNKEIKNESTAKPKNKSDNRSRDMAKQVESINRKIDNMSVSGKSKPRRPRRSNSAPPKTRLRSSSRGRRSSSNRSRVNTRKGNRVPPMTVYNSKTKHD